MKNKKNIKKIIIFLDESHFISGIDRMQGAIAKIISLVMIFIVIVSMINLIVVTIKVFFTQPLLIKEQTFLQILGLFLEIFIALEVLENTTAYLHKHIVQMELVIVTCLVAVARKIIIFDFNQLSGIDLMGLAIAILVLSISYWIVKTNNSKE